MIDQADATESFDPLGEGSYGNLITMHGDGYFTDGFSAEMLKCRRSIENLRNDRGICCDALLYQVCSTLRVPHFICRDAREQVFQYRLDRLFRQPAKEVCSQML